MAKDLNTVVLTGRLTREPDLKYTIKNEPVLELGIAVNEMKKEKQGWVEDPSYLQIRMFGSQAEKLRFKLTKGYQIGVEGYLKQKRWEQDGLKRSMVIIVAKEIKLLSDPGKREPEQPTLGLDEE